MPLIDRFTRLFSADLHAVLDRIEEPEVLLRHALREMEEELARMQERAQILGRERERGEQAMRAVAAALATLESELDICFAAGEESLARDLVRRKLETTRREQALGERRDSNARAARELDTAIAAAGDELNALREQLNLLAAGPDRVAGNSGRAESAIGSAEIEVAFLREKQRRVRP